MASNPVSISAGGNRFQGADGRPFFAVMVNYVGPASGGDPFARAHDDARLIVSDWRRARAAGANTVRAFITPALHQQIAAGDWAGLDALLAAARQAEVYLWLSLGRNETAPARTLAATAGLIAAHCAGDPSLLAYELKNEPGLPDLALAGNGKPAPVLDRELRRLYPLPESTGPAAGASTTGAAPEGLPAETLAAYAACEQAADGWISAHDFKVSAPDFMASPAAAPWQPFLDALNASLAAWLAPQLAAIRVADPGRLVAVAWGDPLLAALPANSALDILALNRFPPSAVRWLRYHVATLAALRDAFPGKPVVLSAFGFPATETDPAAAAIAESAAWLAGFEAGLSGAGKWALFDPPAGPDGRRPRFGLYEPEGAARPGALFLPALAAFMAPSAGPRGHLDLRAGVHDEISYHFDAGDFLATSFTEGGPAAGAPEPGAAESGVRWACAHSGQIVARLARPEAITVWATAPGRVTVDLGTMLGLASLGRYTLEAGGRPLEHTRTGTALSFTVGGDETVTCRLALDALDARIVAVKPYGDMSPARARWAEITTALTFPASRLAVPCDFDGEVRLWRSVDNEPAARLDRAARRLVAADGRLAPVWVFDDVDVSPATEGHRLCFTVRVRDLPYSANVWVYGADARTHLPQPVAATGQKIVAAGEMPVAVDARIQLVWPYGGAPVGEATWATLSADLFVHGTHQSLTPRNPDGRAWRSAVWLFEAVNDGVGRRIARGAPHAWEDGRVSWDFNDIDVSAARNQNMHLHYWIEVEGVITHSNIWTYGRDARIHTTASHPLLGNCT